MANLENNTTELQGLLRIANNLPDANDVPSTAVLYTEQSLTDEQKQQARRNIGVTGTGEKGEKGDKGDDYVLTDADKKEIAELVDDTSAIPDYVITEAESTIAKALSHGQLGRTIRFIAISDTHEDSAKLWNAQITVGNKHAGQAIKYISSRIGLDFIAHLGDASSAGSSVVYDSIDTLINDVKNINKWIFSEVRGIKTAFLVGNHDQCSDKQLKRLQNSGAFTLFGGMCSGNKDRVRGYGYFDIDDANVRVIYLNSADVPNDRVDSVPQTFLAYSQEQKNWLCETLINTNTKENADKWGIIILSHTPLDFGADLSAEIILPYVNGESYNDYNFSGKNSVKIISNVHGHTHSFGYGYLNDKIRRFCIPNACFLGNNHYHSKTASNGKSYIEMGWANPSSETYNKTANTGKDTAFSLVTIDLDSGKCYVDNHGAGVDRVFSTQYKPESAVVPLSISNIGYGGDYTVGATIDKQLFTFTVHYSNGDVRTITGATSVTPSTIQVEGNNTVTITHAEAGYTVSGNTTIVGVAQVLNPTSISNITYSGDTTVGATIDKSKFSFTVHYSNGTTANKTGATSISPTTISTIGNNTITVNYTENGTTVSDNATIIGTEAPVVNLLNLNRTYVSGPVGEMLDNHLDETKAYTNVPYGTRLFDAKTCTVSGITENSVTVKEAGSGGFVVAYYIDLQGLNATQLRVKFDYSGANKCRTYYSAVRSDGWVSAAQTLAINDTNGASGSVDKVVGLNYDFAEIPTGAIIYLGSNTSGTKTFSNMSVTVES